MKPSDLLLVLLTLSAGDLAVVASERSPALALVPRPARVEVGTGRFDLTASTPIVAGTGARTEALHLAERLRQVTGLALAVQEGPTDQRAIVLERDPALEAGLGPEGYSLSVSADRVRVRAAGDAGLFYGGVTLAQLFPTRGVAGSRLQLPAGTRLGLPCLEIEDRPRFPWRGLLLDPARHFLPVEFLHRFVDLMAMHKLNTLQLHLTDDQGWRLEIRKYPRLTDVGSLRQESPRRGDASAGDGLPYGPFFYTQAQMKALVAYAAARHVTIVPEIEIPGHFRAALAAHPEFSCTGGPFEVRTRWGVEPDILCAGSDGAFAFVEDILTEVLEVFPSPFIHTGGDEAPKDRWRECARCQARRKALGLENEAALQSELTARLSRLLASRGRRLVGWDEILEGGLAPGATVMSWRGAQGGIAAANLGHDVVMSPTTHCYFDYAQAKGRSEPECIGGFIPLETVYGFEPVPREVNSEKARHILGAQGNIWGEFLFTPREVEYFAFPRAAALAEVAWSEAKARDYVDFLERLRGHLPRLDAHAVNYRRLDPAGALGYPGPRPGEARLAVGPDAVRFQNAALSVTWPITDQRLSLGVIRDATSGASLDWSGELFVITLRDGTRYPASAFRLERPPETTALTHDPAASRLAGRLPGRRIQAPLRSADGRIEGLWRAIARDEGNYVRQELELTAATADLALRDIAWFEAKLPAARTAGRVDGSPVVAGDFFLGCEDPMAQNLVAADSTVTCRVRRNAPLRKGEKTTQSFVVGVAPPGQMRRGFLYYLERERAHPYRPFLHYNSWYDIAWNPFALNQTNCLEAIHLFGERLIEPYGVKMDAMVFDDGWDDPRTLWQFHTGFPRGFTPLAELSQRYQTRLGVWLSPFGGYGEPRDQRLKHGREQGYETNPTGFSLAGAKYYAAFKQACVDMIQRYGVNHFKFDGIAAGMYADGGAEYVLDTEAMRHLMVELRQADPDLYINLTTGSWPSPFWLRYADSVWRQGGDMGLAGKGPKQQQWLTYRDQEVHQNIVGKGPLYPLNSLMTQGVAYSRYGSAGEPSFNSAGFKDDVRAFFGSGTGLQELYLQPSKLGPEDWAVLAEAAKWSRANADVLVDTHWIGGDPAKLEVYGYASWSPRKGIVMLRNPEDQPREFRLEVAGAFELPPGAPARYRLQSPWAEDAARPAVEAEAGQPCPITLGAFEVLVFEAEPKPWEGQPNRIQ